MATREKLKQVLKWQILDEAEVNETDTLNDVLKHLTDDELHDHIHDFNRYKLNQ